MSLVFRLWKSAWQPTIGTEVFKSIIMLIICKTCVHFAVLRLIPSLVKHISLSG